MAATIRTRVPMATPTPTHAADPRPPWEEEEGGDVGSVVVTPTEVGVVGALGGGGVVVVGVVLSVSVAVEGVVTEGVVVIILFIHRKSLTVSAKHKTGM